MRKKDHSVVIAGYYGFGNAGDELILTSMIQQLRKEHPASPITVFSARPAETSAHFGVKAVNRWKPWRWIKPLWNAELFILGGGGLLQESTGPWNHFYYLSLIALAKVFSCRTEMRAVGVDPVARWTNRIWTRFVMNHLVNFISVRDADSQRALEAIGVQVRIWRMTDPVFSLELPKQLPRIVHKIPRIAWVMSDWPQRPGWEHDLSYLLPRVGQELHVENDLMVFFPERDLPLAQKVSSLAGDHPSVRMWQQPEDLLAWFQDYDFVIAMRYHALVLAALAQKPFIGWGYQRKVRTICRDFSQPMWTFERGWDSEAVFRQIGDAWRRRHTLTEHHREQVAKLVAAPVVSTETARIFVPQV